MAKSRLLMTLDEAESFVDRTPNARWNGWTIELWRPSSNKYVDMQKNASFNPDHPGQNKWGTMRRISPNAKGLYIV